jgi:hypothetical protein
MSPRLGGCETGEDAIALKIAGKSSRDELQEITERIELSLAAREKTHLFVEIENFAGLELAALPDYLPRAAAMLGKLDRFGWIAVVSDLLWIRWATKLERALLPRISYETFTAMSGIARSLGSRASSIRSTTPRSGSSRPTRPTSSAASSTGGSPMPTRRPRLIFQCDAGPEGPVRLLARIKNIEGAEIGALLGHKYLEMKAGKLDRVERYAVVGGPVWLCARVAALDPLVSTELRHFPADCEAQGSDWLGAHPQEDQARAA